jgi:hypothetical protein
VARDREVVRVPLDRGSRGRFALVQQGRAIGRGREFAWLAHQQGKQAHKIDVVIALGMAALAAVKAQSEHTYNWRGYSGPGDPPDWLLHCLLTGGYRQW